MGHYLSERHCFLTSIGEDEEWIDKAGASKTFCVESNQNWSVEISEGKDWLTLESEVEGAGNGTFVVKALPNKGQYVQLKFRFMIGICKFSKW